MKKLRTTITLSLALAILLGSAVPAAAGSASPASSPDAGKSANAIDASSAAYAVGTNTSSSKISADGTGLKSNTLYAVDPLQSASKKSDLKSAYLREDVKVEYNRELLAFKDEKGNPVYPITYKDSTYLPIRAISGLMGEPIEWMSRAKTVYIGKTLTRPMKTIINNHDSPYVEFIHPDLIEKGQNGNSGAAVTEDGNVIVLPGSGPRTVIAVREMKNIYVMYDFNALTFKNEKGEIIYPVNYNGNNYLPLRAIAELMNEDIAWDPKTNTVYIGSMVAIKEEVKKPVREETVAIQELFNKEAEVYNTATGYIAGIAGWTNEDAPKMAASISEALLVAEALSNEAEELRKTETFTEEEEAAAQKLYEFIAVTEYYILVMENIAYLEVAGEDYSMLAETFLDFALASDKAMENAMEAIQALTE